MRKVSEEELAYTARWGYKNVGRGLVVITSQREKYYMSATQAYTLFDSDKHLKKTQVAEELRHGLRTYNPLTHFLVLVTTEEEVTLLMGEYARNDLDKRGRSKRGGKL